MNEIFEFYGIKLSQLPQKYLNRFSGQLIIVGSARCVWEDIKKLNFGSLDADVMTVNDMTMHYPNPVKHCYSNSVSELSIWSQARRKNLNQDLLKHSCSQGEIYWPFPGHGTSSLNACFTGLALGYDSIILAGIPLDNTGHYFEPEWIKSNFQREVPERDGLRWWKDAAEHVFQGKVKSVSGRTRDLLGGI